MAFRSGIPVLITTALLGGCWSMERPAILSTPVSTAPSSVPTNLSGKWALEAPGAGSCTMNFGAQPEATDGTIAPARDCPFNFYASRKWSYVTGALVIRDHKAETLAQLSPVGPDRYEGRTSDGQQLTLSRQ